MVCSDDSHQLSPENPFFFFLINPNYELFIDGMLLLVSYYETIPKTCGNMNEYTKIQFLQRQIH